MRLIDADALMRKLEPIIEAETQIYRRESWGFAVKCMNEVEEAPTPWIRCADTLPGITGAYLVACTNGNVKVGHFSTFDNKWTDAKAVAWMSLPEWEGEADE